MESILEIMSNTYLKVISFGVQLSAILLGAIIIMVIAMVSISYIQDGKEAALHEIETIKNEIFVAFFNEFLPKVHNSLTFLLNSY